MSKINKQHKSNQAYQALLRQSLSSFMQKAFTTVDPGATYLHNWHIDLMAEYLEACTEREITRLIINIPPRYMKSIAVSVAWPAWVIGHEPSSKFLCASYSEKLSLKHSVDCRLVLQSPWYRQLFPQVKLTGDQNEKSKFVTTCRGHRIATSTGGTATGEGGDFLIVDDPHNPKQAQSAVERDNALTWFDQTFYSRLNDKQRGVIVVIMQRLHEKDLTGHLLEQGGWAHLKIPAIAEQSTVMDVGAVHRVREPGDLLHPEREGHDELEKTQLALGSYGFAGQYQQNPVPCEGGMIKVHWFKRYREVPSAFSRIIQSWDTAYKAKQVNDPSVCTTWGEAKSGYYLLDVWRQHVDYPTLKAEVMRLYQQWQPAAVLVEDKASGQSLIQEMRISTRLPVISILPESDKLTRLSAQSAKFEAGLVWLPESAAWLADYERELLTFPMSAHDDQVDSTSQFLGWVSTGAQQYGYERVGNSSELSSRGVW